MKRPRRARRAGAAAISTPLAVALLASVLVASALLAGCGGIKAPDLFVVQRSGSDPHAKLTLLVNEEGGVRCNGSAQAAGHALKLSDAQLVEARAIQEALQEPSAKHTSLAPGPSSVLGFYVRDENGSVRFADDSAGQPKVFHQLALFVLRVAQQVCGLPE